MRLTFDPEPKSFILQGDFFYKCTLFNTASFCCPSDSIVSADAGIERKIVATSALAVMDALATRLHLIHSLHLIHDPES